MSEEIKGNEPKHYTELLSERELNHLHFCRDYAENYAHGAPDHSSMVLIAKLSGFLDIATHNEFPARLKVQGQ